MKKYFFFIVIAIVIALGFYLYTLHTYTYITAEFKELRPFHNALSIYYKGIVVGKAKEKFHSEDFQHTLINLELHKRNIMLPENTIVLLKKEKRNNKERDFLELVYPKEPSDIMLSNGSKIKGITTIDVDTFMANQHQDDLEQIKQNLLGSTESLEAALSGLSELFVLLQDVVKDNENNLVTASKNLSDTAGNLKQITSKFDKSIHQEKLDNTMDGISSSIQNLETVTGGLGATTESLNIAMPRVDATLYEVQALASNANAISCGIRQTLAKRFGGLRLLFGKTINENCCENLHK